MLMILLSLSLLFFLPIIQQLFVRKRNSLPVQASSPKGSFRSVATIGGGKAQSCSSPESIVIKPKKLLSALLCLIFVAAFSVGCSSADMQEPSRVPEIETTETTVPTEEPIFDATEESVPLEHEDPLFNLYEDSTYDGTSSVVHFGIQCIYRDENYEIPMIYDASETSDSSDTSTSYRNEVNSEIMDRYGMILEGDYSQYKSVTYRWNVATLEGVDPCLQILVLDITAVDQQNNTESFFYCMKASSGDPIRRSNYSESLQSRVSRELIRELYDEYIANGVISFTEQDYETYVENLSNAENNAAIKVLSHNALIFTVPYIASDGSVRDLEMTSNPTESIPLNALYEPKVIDLFTYPHWDGGENTIPFVLLDTDAGIALNVEILQEFLAPRCFNVSYTAAIHRDILSFSIRGQHPDYGGWPSVLVENLFTDPAKDGNPDVEYVLARAKVPMTYEEYVDKAKVMIPSYFFDYLSDYLKEVPENISEHYSDKSYILPYLRFCGSATNIANSSPYLDKEGNVWTCAEIRQVAGADSAYHMIPISAAKINSEYQTFAEECGLYPEPQEVLQDYLEQLYGKSDYVLSYSEENAYPEYDDDRIHVDCYKDHILINIKRELIPTLTEQDIANIPELQAATDFLGVSTVVSVSPISMLEDDTVTAYTMTIPKDDGYFTEDRYVDLVWGVNTNKVYLLIYWGL